MEEGFTFDNILSSQEVENLFINTEEIEESTPPDKEGTETEEIKETKETTEVDIDTLFIEEPESVGSEDIEGTGDTVLEKKDGTSSNDFYSSIAKALQEDGIFPDLTADDFKDASSPEGFRALIEKQINASFDDRQKRIDEALNLNVEPSQIKQYENTIDYLERIQDDVLSKEGDENETLRKQLIYQDFINRGYTEARAQREVQKSLNAGTDIEDAREALKSNKEFYQGLYNDLIEDARKEKEKVQAEVKKQANTLKKSILESPKVFGEIEIDKNTRQKVFDNISKPIYKDPETGTYYTALQKYEKENKLDFIKNVGVLFTLTNGFKDINKLIKEPVRKQVNKGIRNLEKTITGARRTSDGSLSFVSGVNDDPDSTISPGWTLDV